MKTSVVLTIRTFTYGKISGYTILYEVSKVQCKMGLCTVTIKKKEILIKKLRLVKAVPSCDDGQRELWLGNNLPCWPNERSRM